MHDIQFLNHIGTIFKVHPIISGVLWNQKGVILSKNEFFEHLKERKRKMAPNDMLMD